MKNKKMNKIVSHRLSSSTLLLLHLWVLVLLLREGSCNKQNNKDRRLRGSRIPLLGGLFQRSSPSSRPSARKPGRRGFWNRNRKRQDSQAPVQQNQKEEDEEEEDPPDEEQQPEEVTQVPGNMLPHGIFRGVRDRLFRDSSERSRTGQDYDDDNETSNSLIPLIYRYYGRNRARTHTAGSIPFLILGPNVDHWKIIGQHLAAKGFSVMACERVREDDSTPSSLQCTLPSTAPHQLSRATQTLLTLLDALRWKRVVLVACDSESALAVRAALELAPDRIVGLVLCGSLEPVEPLIQEYTGNRDIRSTYGSSVSYFLGSTPPSPVTFPHGVVAVGSGQTPNTFHVDRFLKANLKCPFTIVWGGDDSPVTDDDDDDTLLLPPSLPAPSTEYSGINDAAAAARRTILGGGSAPHRRRPEMFAWVLTRFVEEEIATGPSLLPIVQHQQQQQQQQQPAVQQQRTILAKASRNSTSTNTASLVTIPISQRQAGGLHLPFELQEFFSSQAMVVIGRVMATALFYATALRVGYYQYDNFWHGIRNVSTQLCKYISKPSIWGRKIFQVVHSGGSLAYLRQRGVVPILSCLKRVVGGILCFLPFQKDDSDQDKEATDDSERDVPETKPSPGKKDEEQADHKKDDNDKDNDSGTRKNDGNDSEEVKPGIKPFFLLDRVIA